MSCKYRPRAEEQEPDENWPEFEWPLEKPREPREPREPRKPTKKPKKKEPEDTAYPYAA